MSSVGQDTDKILLGEFNARTGITLVYLQSEDNTDIPVPLDIQRLQSMTLTDTNP